MQTALRQHVSAGRESDDVMGCIHVFVGRYGLAMHAETTLIYIYNTQSVNGPFTGTRKIH